MFRTDQSRDQANSESVLVLRQSELGDLKNRNICVIQSQIILLYVKRRAGVMAAGTGVGATGAWTITIGPGGGHGTECDTTAGFTTGAITGRGFSIVAFLPLASADSLVERINKEIANMNFTGFITRNLQSFEEEIEFGLSNVPNLHVACEFLVNEVSIFRTSKYTRQALGYLAANFE